MAHPYYCEQFDMFLCYNRFVLENIIDKIQSKVSALQQNVIYIDMYAMNMILEATRETRYNTRNSVLVFYLAYY